MILYQLLRISFISEESGLDTSFWSLAPAVLFPCAGAYRLARFNIDTKQRLGFRGVPIPAAGLVVASLPLIMLYNYFDLVNVLLNKWVLYAVILVLSYLMVSRMSLMAMKFKDLSLKNNFPKFLLVVLAIIAAIFLQWLAVPVIFILYIILSLAFKNKIA